MPPQALRSNQAMHSAPEVQAHLALVKQKAAMAIRRLPEVKPLGRAMDLEPYRARRPFARTS